MTDVIRKTYFCRDAQIQEFDLKKPFVQKTWYHFANRAFDVAHAFTDRIAKRHPLYERAAGCRNWSKTVIRSFIIPLMQEKAS